MQLEGRSVYILLTGRRLFLSRSLSLSKQCSRAGAAEGDDETLSEGVNYYTTRASRRPRLGGERAADFNYNPCAARVG